MKHGRLFHFSKFIVCRLGIPNIINPNYLFTMNRTFKKWTAEEDARLIEQVKAFPQNLSQCFLIVSEITGRTPAAVAFHWYSVLSKRPDVTCFFTASPRHISKNRKNALGIESNRSIWQRLLSIIRNL